MNVKILNVVDRKLIDAIIIDGKKLKLPSLQEGWRFNFSRHAKGKDVYVIVTKETPDVIEGCLIYKMNMGLEPYMCFIEIAPQNKGINKKYDNVAGCLIAFACRLSFIMGEGDYKGYLVFDVQEERQEDEIKLMGMYSVKYHAKRIAKTTMMIIEPEDGETLIEKYLNN